MAKSLNDLSMFRLGPNGSVPDSAQRVGRSPKAPDHTVEHERVVEFGRALGNQIPAAPTEAWSSGPFAESDETKAKDGGHHAVADVAVTNPSAGREWLGNAVPQTSVKPNVSFPKPLGKPGDPFYKRGI